MMLTEIGRKLDGLLDQTVVFSYPRLGYTLRRPFWDSGIADMSGKHVLITGANAGLGYAAAEGLAKLGAILHLVARNPERGEIARQHLIKATGNSQIRLEIADVSDLDAVRAFASHFLAETDRLDVLIHNAGVLLPERQVSADGIEMTWATNIIGPFLLTALLEECLIDSAPARLLFVSSGGMYTQRLMLDDWHSEKDNFDGVRTYAQTKRAQVILGELWAQRLRENDVSVNTMHPGWADTPGLKVSLPRFHRLLRPFLRSAAQGADTLVWLAASPDLETETGRFWFDRRARSTHKLASTRDTESDRRQLWELCLRESGLLSNRRFAFSYSRELP